MVVVVLQGMIVNLSSVSHTDSTYVVIPPVTVDVSGTMMVVCSVLLLVWTEVVCETTVLVMVSWTVFSTLLRRSIEGQTVIASST